MTGTHPLPCNTVVQAQAWNLLKIDPVAGEERWRYHYLMEIFKDDVTCNCLGDLPSDNTFDVKGMLIQEKLRDAFEPIRRRHEAPDDGKIGTSCIILGRRRRLVEIDGGVDGKVRMVSSLRVAMYTHSLL